MSRQPVCSGGGSEGSSRARRSVCSSPCPQRISPRKPAAAPQNASIRKQDLKADVYFLADDLTRGRLVGTPEYALAAEFVKSRFERLGLTPAGPGGTYFHSFNLMVATLGGDDRTRWRSTEGPASTRARRGSGRTSIRIASAPADACTAASCSRASASPRRRCHGTTTPATHQGQDRADSRSRAGRARSGEPVRRRGHRRTRRAVPQGARGAGEGRDRRAVRLGRPQSRQHDARRAELPGRVRVLLARETAAHRPLLPRRLSREDPHSRRADLVGDGRDAAARHEPHARRSREVGGRRLAAPALGAARCGARPAARRARFR